MKIAIYGVSRCGKDYLIKKIVNYLNTNSQINTFHLEGSKTLNELSNSKFGYAFKYLSESQKSVLRKEFTSLINQKESEYQLVIVDGHYSFITEDEYQVVFTESDRDAYDAFFYLDTPSEKIVQYSRNSEGDKRNLAITKAEIFNWKSYEKRGLSSVCDLLGKELIILDEDTNSSIEFIKSFVLNYKEKYSYKAIAKRLIDKISDELENKEEVVVFDCDKTVSHNDVTYDFCCSLGISSNELKKIFRNDRYSSYQFFKVQKLYEESSHAEIHLASHNALAQIKLSDEVTKYISSLKNAYILGVTSGVYEIWDLISREHNLFDCLFGSTSTDITEYLVTPLLKKQIVLELQSRNKKVSAVGDSMIDIPMLEVADKGYIVAHQKLNDAVTSYFEWVDGSKIKPFFCSKYSYGLCSIEGN